jgi:TonB-dependent SusC/RagA subfamily outer membrane receptor
MKRHCLMTKLNWAFDRGLFLILALMLTSNLLAQEKKTISGTVKDKSGMTMPGVYVIIKNTSTGTITNAEGNFSIAVPNMQAVVVFSSIGYKSIENIALNVNGKTMVMEESEATKIDEVVVIGYGTAKRKDLTGSVGKVDMESMARAPVANFDQALAGRIAGVVVTSNDGQPGAASQITIRGGSVTQDATPLYILDGFPIENLDVNSINPNDIETFDVLKDASSIAIYGARGANGVISIRDAELQENPGLLTVIRHPYNMIPIG